VFTQFNLAQWNVLITMMMQITATLQEIRHNCSRGGDSSASQHLLGVHDWVWLQGCLHISIVPELFEAVL